MDFVLDNNLNMFEQYTDGMNLYAYCRNQPGFLMDPWGLISIWTPVGPGYDRIIDGFMQCYKEALRQVKNAEKQPWYGDHKTMHCVVACELTKKEGTACAWAAGFGHKLGEKFRDYKRDRNAEAVGRDCGNAPSVCGEAPNKSCEECCQDKGQTDSRG